MATHSSQPTRVGLVSRSSPDAPIEQLIALVGPRFADWRDDARAAVDRLTGALGAIARPAPSASRPVRDIARDASCWTSAPGCAAWA